MLTHYFDVVIRMPEITHELHGRLLHLVHSTIRRDHVQLAASWPDMKHKDFGFVFRVFGTPDALDSFIPACAPLVERKMVRLYPPAPIPGHAIIDHYFARDRRNEKNTEGFHKRVIARCSRRGVEQYKPRTPIAGHYPLYLTIQSGSTGQAFTIYIKRIDGSAPEGAGGNNYGLGLNLPSF